MPKPRHVHETYIRTTPERLWQALTDGHGSYAQPSTTEAALAWDWI